MATALTPLQKAIERLRKAEAAARRAQNLLDSAEAKWNRDMATLRGTPEWEAYCKAQGIVADYNFGDVLA